MRGAKKGKKYKKIGSVRIEMAGNSSALLVGNYSNKRKIKKEIFQ